MNRILIVKLSSLGDIIHCLPAVAQLRNTFPTAQIDWLVERKNRTLIEMSQIAVNIIPIDIGIWRNNIGLQTLIEIAQLIKKIRAVKYDCAIDFQGLIKSGFLTYLSGAACRIGFSWKALKEPIAGVFYTKRSTTQQVHIINQQRDLLQPLGIAPNDQMAKLSVAKEIEERVQAKLHSISKYIVINPGALWLTKRWPEERFLELAQRLVGAGFPVVITWAPDEVQLFPKLASDLDSRIYKMATTLEELVALCAGAHLFVSGDTGPLHIAVAMGTPIVAIFGPTDSRRNGPIDTADIVVERSLSCRPCYKRSTCPLGHWNCMEEISVDDLYAACLTRLGMTEN